MIVKPVKGRFIAREKGLAVCACIASTRRRAVLALDKIRTINIVKA